MGLLNKEDKDTFRVWAKALEDMTAQELARGLKKAMDFTGFFNLPAFRELCRTSPQDHGLPTAKAAYLEACMKPTPKAHQQWMHPAVYHAGRECGWFELANLPESQSYPRFEAMYQQMVQRVIDGESLEAPALEALPERISRVTEPEAAKAHIESLKAIMGE
jgi:hypothetical protein